MASLSSLPCDHRAQPGRLNHDNETSEKGHNTNRTKRHFVYWPEIALHTSYPVRRQMQDGRRDNRKMTRYLASVCETSMGNQRDQFPDDQGGSRQTMQGRYQNGSRASFQVGGAETGGMISSRTNFNILHSGQIFDALSQRISSQHSPKRFTRREHSKQIYGQRELNSHAKGWI